jgi:plastocyanin
MISGKRLVAAVFALSTVVVLGATACSSAGRSADPTPVQTWWITPSALGAATKPAGAPTAAPSATPAGAATSAATSAATAAATAGATSAATTPSAGGQTIKLIAVNLTFDKTSLTASAGKITFELDNQDAGQPHNIHIYKGADVSGESMGMSDLNVGPVKDILNVTLEKGSYFFQCDVHPTTMAGTLAVN